MSSMSVSVPSETRGAGRRPVAGVGRRVGVRALAPAGASSVARLGRAARPLDHGGAEAAGDVGQLHAVHAAAVVVVEREHLGQLGGPALLVEDGDVGAGQHEVLDRVAVDVCQCRKVASSTKPNSARLHAAAPRARASWSWVPMSRAEPAHPRDPLVALVPDQREPAAGLEHPGDLGQRPVVVEPVERLRAAPRRRTTRRGSGISSAAATEVATSGSRRASTASIARRGRWRARRGRARPAARSACRCRRRARARSRGSVADQPGRGLAGVRRAAAVVGVGDGAEGTGPGRRCSVTHRPHATGSVAGSPGGHWLASVPMSTDPAGLADLPRGRAVGVRRRPRRHRRDAARPRAAPYLPGDDRRVAAARRPRERGAGGLGLDAGRGPRRRAGDEVAADAVRVSTELLGAGAGPGPLAAAGARPDPRAGRGGLAARGAARPAARRRGRRPAARRSPTC